MSILMGCPFKVGVHKVGFNCVRNCLLSMKEGWSLHRHSHFFKENLLHTMRVKGFHKEAFKLWNYVKNNFCHPVIIEWFSVQIIFCKC